MLLGKSNLKILEKILSVRSLINYTARDCKPQLNLACTQATLMTQKPKMARASLLSLVTWSVIFMYGTNRAEAQDECNVNADCNNVFKVCCKTCQFFSCLGRHCVKDGDCGGKGECCNSQHQCVTFGCPECHSHSDCAPSEYCCKQRFINDHNVCRRSCVGETCHSSSDCGVGECCIFNKCTTIGCSECVLNSDCPSSEYCCFRGFFRNMCKQSCVGQTCLSSIGCGGPREYCDANSRCTKSDNSTTFAGWAIAIVVIGNNNYLNM